MAPSVTKYKWLCGGALTLLLVDLSFNTAFLLFLHHPLPTLLIYIIQGVALVLSFILITFAIFSTSSAQAGLVGDVLYRFRWTIIICILYLSLSLSFHWYSLRQKWNSPHSYIWNDGMLAFFSCQRLVSAVYYYMVKRTILILSDAKLYTLRIGSSTRTSREELPES